MDGPDTKVICVAAMDLFRQEGLRFTMQQLAQRLHISKKTLYTRYASKEELLLDMIDGAFGAIHARKRAILAENLPLEEKLRRVIIALPEEYAATNLCRLEELEEKFGISFENEEFETLNGFLISRLDKIPEPDEQFDVDYKGYNFKILSVENKMIQSVLVTKLPEETKEDDEKHGAGIGLEETDEK